jgi:hypothetical protein
VALVEHLLLSIWNSQEDTRATRCGSHWLLNFQHYLSHGSANFLSSFENRFQFDAFFVILLVIALETVAPDVVPPG